MDRVIKKRCKKCHIDYEDNQSKPDYCSECILKNKK